MPYDDGEALALTVVRNHANFDSSNARRGNWQILSSGDSDHYAILRPGPFNRSLATSRRMMAEWTTVVELWQRVKERREDALPLLEGFAMDLINQFDAANRLGDGNNVIVDSQVASGGDVLEVDRGGGSLWLKWELNVAWREKVDVTFND